MMRCITRLTNWCNANQDSVWFTSGAYIKAIYSDALIDNDHIFDKKTRYGMTLQEVVNIQAHARPDNLKNELAVSLIEFIVEFNVLSLLISCREDFEMKLRMKISEMIHEIPEYEDVLEQCYYQLFPHYDLELDKIQFLLTYRVSFE